MKSFNRVACYLRVSTENQIENYSIAEQKERLEAFCKAKDYKIFKFYIDPGYSGGNTNRPALQQMLSDIKSKNIDMVIVYKLDRLSRSQKDTLTLIEDNFIANNVEFISVNENFDTSTPFGRAMIGILSVFAQLEKDQITERFTMGRIGRAKNGLYHGGSTIPTGYDYVDGKLVINEYEANQIREIYKRFLNGESINSIQKYMHETYKKWSGATNIYYVLKNSLYIGKVKFKGKEYDGEHQPIIDKETFDKVQKLLNSSARNDKKNSAQKTPFRAGYLLSSLIYCGNCGAKYCAEHGNYSCYSRTKSSKKFIKDPTCKNIKIKINELDEFVKNEILNLSFNDESIENLKAKQFTPVDTAPLKKRLKELSAQMSRLVDLYQIGDISTDDIKKRIKKLQSEKAMIETQIENASSQDDINKRIENFKNLLSQSERILNNAPLQSQRLFVSSLIQKVIVHPSGEIEISWRV